MGDPVSVAGSAVGVISLGIQVTQSLHDYYSAFRSQYSDINHTIERLGSLLELLERLRQHAERRKFRADEEGSMRKIESLIHESEEVIKELEAEASKFKEVSVSSIKTAIRTTARRVAYPFRRSTLEKLDEDVTDIIDRLDIALQILQQEVLDRIRDEVQDIQALLDLVSSSQRSSDLQNWLKAPDATINFNEACKKKHPGTGLWLVQGSAFRTWLDSPQSFLWLRGFAGSGKSVLCSTAIQYAFQHLRSNPKTCIAFFFFAFNDSSKQDTTALLRALILQLSTQLDDHTELSRLRDCYRHATPPDQALLKLLRQQVRKFKDVYILIDALDESPAGHPREAVLEAIRNVQAWNEPGLHILVTSRDEVDIRDELEATPAESIDMRDTGVDQDIAAFVAQHLRDNRRLRKWEQHYERIEEALTTRADGVFRWVECQFKALVSLPVNQALLDKTLQSLPRSLDDTYARMLRNIAPESREYAQQMLAILCCAFEPLSDLELIDALAVELGDHPKFDARRKFRTADDLQVLCPGFVEVDNYLVADSDSDSDSYDEADTFESGTEGKAETDGGTGHVRLEKKIRIAHFSVQEFLEAERILTYKDIASFHVQRQDRHTDMASVCLAVLLEPSMTKLRDPKVAKTRYPLAKYAAYHWSGHMKLGTYRTCVESQVLQLFEDPEGALTTWIRIEDGTYTQGRPRFFSTPNPIYYATLLGLDRVVVKLLDKTLPASATSSPFLQMARGGKVYDTALAAAAEFGHKEMVELLLDKGADIGARDESHETALHRATDNGYKEIIGLLLDRGADVNAQHKYRGTALHEAARRGHKEIVELLLDGGADVNAKGPEYRGTALHVAALRGHKEIVELLLDGGADVNANGPAYRGTALHVAALRGWKEIVELLLVRGADSGTHRGVLRTAPQTTAEASHSVIVELLHDEGAQDIDGALKAAACWNRKVMVDLLLSEGALRFRGALKAAVKVPVEVSLEIPLKVPLEIPLEECLFPENLSLVKETVELLLSKGAQDVDRVLDKAVAAGSRWAVKLLLDKEPRDIRAALEKATFHGRDEIAALLRSWGAGSTM
ncbi:ankyrin repeat-containing protein [Xylariomycetidae sp. FL0641]|nr:ankyrin repeat-containing protein [Xylariomycetidae sp. FL0641]